jgi:hypothetical protein
VVNVNGKKFSFGSVSMSRDLTVWQLLKAVYSDTLNAIVH